MYPTPEKHKIVPKFLFFVAFFLRQTKSSFFSGLFAKLLRKYYTQVRKGRRGSRIYLMTVSVSFRSFRVVSIPIIIILYYWFRPKKRYRKYYEINFKRSKNQGMWLPFYKEDKIVVSIIDSTQHLHKLKAW